MRKTALLFVSLFTATLLLSFTYSPSDARLPREAREGRSLRDVPTISIPQPTKFSLPTPTQKQGSTPTPTLKQSTNSTTTPTNKPTPTLTSQPAPTSTQSAISLDEKQKFMVDEINKYRASIGLTSVKSDKYTCDFGKVRAQEISKDFSHDGFSDRVANKTIPYPSYRLITENIAMTSDYKKVVSMWINSPGHAENMRRDTPFVCVGTYNNYYAYEGWKP